MNRILAMFLFLFAGAVHAQPFVEFGIGAVVGGCIANGYSGTISQARGANRSIASAPLLGVLRSLSVDHTQIDCSRGAIGIAAIGYQLTDQWSVQYEHLSSLPDSHDRGLELLSIRYRYTFK